MGAQEALTALVTRTVDPEPLHEDLRPYVHYTRDGTWQILSHKLVQQIPYHPSLNAQINGFYHHKQQAVAQALQGKNWSQYIWLHERPWRWGALEAVVPRIAKDEEYWRLFKQVWVDSENIWQNKRIIRTLLRRSSGRDLLMDAPLKAELKVRIDPATGRIPVWRGAGPKNTRGYSWTLDRDRAVWFAYRLRPASEPAMLVSGVVRLEQIIAYIMDRGEDEVIIEPGRVQNTICQELEPEERGIKEGVT